METTLQDLLVMYQGHEVVRLEVDNKEAFAYWMIWDDDTAKTYGNIPMHMISTDELAYKNKWHDEVSKNDTISDVMDSVMMTHEINLDNPYDMNKVFASDWMLEKIVNQEAGSCRFRLLF